MPGKLLAIGTTVIVMLAVGVMILLAVIVGGFSVQVAAACTAQPAASGAAAAIPADYLADYQSAGTQYGIQWTVLAGIGTVESDNGRNDGPSSAGALGPMQFLPKTWKIYGDGVAGDIMNPADAIPAAARYLVALGALSNLQQAIFGYNHSKKYVSDVLAWAARYAAGGANAIPAPGSALCQQAVSLTFGYMNPLRAISGLVPDRIDQGVDFAGTGAIYAIGDAVITNASTTSGWPGGGGITYELIDGPDAGLIVYVTEDVRPDVTPGETVYPTTVIGHMFPGTSYIETGWAAPNGFGALSDLPEAGSIHKYGPFPTMVGISFDLLLVSLGVPPAPNIGQSSHGLLPPGYPG